MAKDEQQAASQLDLEGQIKAEAKEAKDCARWGAIALTSLCE